MAKAPSLVSTQTRNLGGYYCWEKWDNSKSIEAFQKAIEVNPNESKNHAYYAHLLKKLHRPEESLMHIEKALELDPYNPLIQSLYGMNMMYTRQFDKAINLLSTTLINSPTDPLPLSTLRTAYHMKGMYNEAFYIWKKSYTAKGDQQAVTALEEGENNGGYFRALESLAGKSIPSP